MASKNDVTGDTIATKYNSQKFVDNWDLIFKKKDEQKVEDLEQKEVDTDAKPN